MNKKLLPFAAKHLMETLDDTLGKINSKLCYNIRRVTKIMYVAIFL